MGKLDKVAERIVGVNKEIQKSVNGQLEATRDAVQTTNQTTGMESLIVLGVVFVLRFADVTEAAITAWAASRSQCAGPKPGLKPP